MNENVTDLVIQIQNGENAAFEKIFEIYKVSAIRTAYLLTNNKALAEDITQEAFVQCYLKINTLKNPAQFKTWFFKILTRIAWKINTKEKEAIPVENIFEIYNTTDNSSVEDNFINKETSEKIMAAINQLEQKQKTVVLLYYYNDDLINYHAIKAIKGESSFEDFSAHLREDETLEKIAISDSIPGAYIYNNDYISIIWEQDNVSYMLSQYNGILELPQISKAEILEMAQEISNS